MSRSYSIFGSKHPPMGGTSSLVSGRGPTYPISRPGNKTLTVDSFSARINMKYHGNYVSGSSLINTTLRKIKPWKTGQLQINFITSGGR